MRIFYTPDIETTTILPLEESAHCVRVLRLQEGDELLLTDGKGAFYKAIIEIAHPKKCHVAIQEKISPPSPRDFTIDIALAPTKNMDRTEWFVEKATEIGIDTIYSFVSRYSERKKLKTERLEKRAISAMKQSKKPTLPKIEPLLSLKELLTRPYEGQKFIAHCYKEMERIELFDAIQPGQNVLLLIGPEGDFSPEEVELALSNGFQPISLGSSRLRTETAALVGCHTVHLAQKK